MGGHSTVVSELDALTARYPLRERMWANLMLALYRLGRQAEALAAYQRARQVLADELGSGALTGAPTPQRADPAGAIRRSASANPRGRPSDRAAWTCNPARRSPATASSAPWVAAA